MSIRNISRRESARPAGGWFKRPAVHFLRFAALLALYLLLTESLDLPELAMGAAAALISVAGLAALTKHNDVHFHFELRWLKSVLAAPRDIIRDSLLILGNLPAMIMRPKKSFGYFWRRRLRESIPDLEMPAWRAFEVAHISLAPNTYVVDIKASAGARLLVHQLVPHPSSGKPRLP